MPYLNTNSILNRVDPRVKIVMTIVLIFATFFVSNWIVLGLFLFLVAGLVVLAKIPILYCLKKLQSPAIMIVIMLVLQRLIAPQTNAFWHGLLVFVRLMIVIISVIILTSTTKQQDFILSLEFFLCPAFKIGLKTGAVMLTFRIIGRFVPSVTGEARKILKAQASRGLDIKGANIWMKIRLIGALLLPVFVLAIKRADDLASSMAVRGYVIDKERSSYRVL